MITALIIYGVSLAICSMWLICSLKGKHNPYMDYVSLILAVAGFMWFPVVNTIVAAGLVLFGFRLFDGE
jgi:hypothetical protein